MGCGETPQHLSTMPSTTTSMLLLLSSLFVSQVIAVGPSDHSILARQIPFDPQAVPEACEAPCEPVIKIISGEVCALTDPACICTQANVDNFSKCFGCFVDQGGVSSEKIEAQSIQFIQTIEATCKEANIAVPSFSVPSPSATADNESSASAPDASETPGPESTDQDEDTTEAEPAGGSAVGLNVVQSSLLWSAAAAVALFCEL